MSTNIVVTVLVSFAKHQERGCSTNKLTAIVCPKIYIIHTAKFVMVSAEELGNVGVTNLQ